MSSENCQRCREYSISVHPPLNTLLLTRDGYGNYEIVKRVRCSSDGSDESLEWHDQYGNYMEWNPIIWRKI